MAALRSSVRTRSEIRSSLVQKSIKLFSTPTRGFSKKRTFMFEDAQKTPHTIEYGDPAAEEKIDYFFRNSSHHSNYRHPPCPPPLPNTILSFGMNSNMDPCKTDANGCYGARTIKAAELFVSHFNNKHNTEFQLVRVLKAKENVLVNIMTMILDLKYGHLPHTYWVNFRYDDSPNGEGLSLGSWRTLDRFEYETVFPRNS